MTKFSALDISNFYIQLVNSLPGDSIDNLKLNKLLYFAQGWSLARYGKPLFSDDIEAWEYGPVIPAVYHAYKKYKDAPISAPSEKFDEAQLTSDEVSLLTDVYSNYGQYTGVALMNRTHRPETLWRQVYEKGRNHIITEGSMMEYFKKHHADFQPFDTSHLDIPVVDKAPAAWDSQEDAVYA